VADRADSDASPSRHDDNVGRGKWTRNVEP
jgi:hypothetical protein